MRSGMERICLVMLDDLKGSRRSSYISRTSRPEA